MDITWAAAIETMKPFIFRVSTPSGHGTGVLLSFSKKTKLCGVATALHVVDHSFEWQEPIKLRHFESSKEVLIKAGGRYIFRLPEKDLAFVLFLNSELPLQENKIPLAPKGKFLIQGVQMGWCGFPSVAPHELCFFSGPVSCYLQKQESYLVDGVAINGVSGGPAFTTDEQNTGIVLCGIVTAYISNSSPGGITPGVCFIRDIAPYHAQIENFKTLDDAAKQAVATEEPRAEIQGGRAVEE